MTKSKAYKNADAFERKLMREIATGKQLQTHGWNIELPADIHTLESVLEWYQKFKKNPTSF